MPEPQLRTLPLQGKHVLVTRTRDQAGVLSEKLRAAGALPVELPMIRIVPPQPGFLDELRHLTRAYGAVLVFDEAMIGFRVALGGMQERVGIDPDLTCLGKIIGGGLPVGAYGGRREIMQLVAPSGPMYQAGTLSGNPLAMAGGIATLKELRKSGQYDELERKSKLLEDGLSQAIQQSGIPAQFARIGSMFTIFFSAQPVHNYADAKNSDTHRFAHVFWSMLRQGVYLPPSQFEACFVSLAFDDAMMEETIKCATRAFKELA